MNNAKFVNIARLEATYNLQIDNEALPDALRCVKCKLVLRDPCAVPCGCRFCRACINDMMAGGDEFCSGDLEECRESLLSHFLTDYRANNSISKLTVRCPHEGCLHECSLVNIEDHIQECLRKNVECPFHNLGCKQDKMAIEEMCGHFHQENRSHSEILIGMIAGIHNEMAALRLNEENSKREIEMLKHELKLKDEQIRTILDQIGHVENENKSMKLEFKSLQSDIECIEKENADLTDRVRILSEEIEQEIDERREKDERNIVEVTEKFEREINAMTEVIASNKNECRMATTSIKDDLRSIKQDIKSIEVLNCAINTHAKSSQEPEVTKTKFDAYCDFQIDDDVSKKSWYFGCRVSEYFTGNQYPYKYHLESWNDGWGYTDGVFGIRLRIVPGLNDDCLPWPFRGKVIVVVYDKRNAEASLSIAMQCTINRPAEYSDCRSDQFRFPYASLIAKGVDLSIGVGVLCVINPCLG